MYSKIDETLSEYRIISWYKKIIKDPLFLNSIREYKLAEKIEHQEKKIFAFCKGPLAHPIIYHYLSDYLDLDSPITSEVPFTNFELEPAHISQIKKLINSLYYARTGLHTLEGTELSLAKFWDSIYRIHEACYLITHLDVDITELFAQEFNSFFSIVKPLKNLLDQQFPEAKKAFTQFSISERAGDIIGMTVRKLHPVNEQMDYSFLTEIGGYAPIWIENVTRTIEKFTVRIKTDEPGLNQEKIEELRTAAVALLNDLEHLHGNSLFFFFKAFKYIHIIRNILVLAISTLEQLGKLSERSQEMICDNLNHLKYTYIAQLFVVVDKIEMNALLKPGTLTMPLLKKIHEFYEKIIYLPAKIIDFAHRRPDLLTLDEPQFFNLRIDAAKQRITEIQGSQTQLRTQEQILINLMALLHTPKNMGLSLSKLSQEAKNKCQQYLNTLAPSIEELEEKFPQSILDSLKTTHDRGLIPSRIAGKTSTVADFIRICEQIETSIGKKLNSQAFQIELNSELIHNLSASIPISPLVNQPLPAGIEIKLEKSPPSLFLRKAEFLHTKNYLEKVIRMLQKEFKTINAELADNELIPLNIRPHMQAGINNLYSTLEHRLEFLAPFSLRESMKKFAFYLHALHTKVPVIGDDMALNYNEFKHLTNSVQAYLETINLTALDGVEAIYSLEQQKILSPEEVKSYYQFTLKQQVDLLKPTQQIQTISLYINQLLNLLYSHSIIRTPNWPLCDRAKENKCDELLDEFMTKNKSLIKKITFTPHQFCLDSLPFADKQNFFRSLKHFQDKVYTLLAPLPHVRLQRIFIFDKETFLRCIGLYQNIQQAMPAILPAELYHSFKELDAYFLSNLNLDTLLAVDYNFFGKVFITPPLDFSFSPYRYEHFVGIPLRFFSYEKLLALEQVNTHISEKVNALDPVSQEIQNSITQTINMNAQLCPWTPKLTPREGYLLKSAFLSPHVDRLCDEVIKLVGYFDVPVLKMLLPADRIAKTLPDNHTELRKTLSELLINYLHTSLSKELPFPEMEGHQHLGQGQQIRFLKVLLNNLYLLKQAALGLERLKTTKSDSIIIKKGLYVFNLYSIYNHIHGMISSYRHLTQDAYGQEIHKTILSRLGRLKSYQQELLPYQQDPANVPALHTPVKYSSMWYVLNFFYLSPEHLSKLNSDARFNQQIQLNLQIQAKNSTQAIERIINSSDSYFKLFLQAPSMWSLYTSLQNKVSELTSGIYHSLMDHLEDIKTKVIEVMLDEAQVWEERLGLVPGCLQLPLKKITFEFYKNLLHSLNLPSETYLGLLCSMRYLENRKINTRNNQQKLQSESYELSSEYANFYSLYHNIQLLKSTKDKKTLLNTQQHIVNIYPLVVRRLTELLTEKKIDSLHESNIPDSLSIQAITETSLDFQNTSHYIGAAHHYGVNEYANLHSLHEHINLLKSTKDKQTQLKTQQHIVKTYPLVVKQLTQLLTEKKIDSLQEKPNIPDSLSMQALTEAAPDFQVIAHYISAAHHYGVNEYANLHSLHEHINLLKSTQDKQILLNTQQQIVQIYPSVVKQLRQLLTEKKIDSLPEKCNIPDSLSIQALTEYTLDFQNTSHYISAAHHYGLGLIASKNFQIEATHGQLSFIDNEQLQWEQEQQQLVLLEHLEEHFERNLIALTHVDNLVNHQIKEEYRQNLQEFLQSSKQEIFKAAAPVKQVDKEIAQRMRQKAEEFKKQHHTHYFQLDRICSTLFAFCEYLRPERHSFFEDEQSKKPKAEIINAFLSHANNTKLTPNQRLAIIQQQYEDNSIRYATTLLEHRAICSWSWEYVKMALFYIIEALHLFTSTRAKLFYQFKEDIKPPPPNPHGFFAPEVEPKAEPELEVNRPAA
ncbi:MAG: hypothetical protein J0I93_06975 [Legionella sp.]|nr:hypothetical protein [Legionella sp.]